MGTFYIHYTAHTLQLPAHRTSSSVQRSPKAPVKNPRFSIVLRCQPRSLPIFLCVSEEASPKKANCASSISKKGQRMRVGSLFRYCMMSELAFQCRLQLFGKDRGTRCLIMAAAQSGDLLLIPQMPLLGFQSQSRWDNVRDGPIFSEGSGIKATNKEKIKIMKRNNKN